MINIEKKAEISCCPKRKTKISLLKFDIYKIKKKVISFEITFLMERETRFELATFTLAR